MLGAPPPQVWCPGQGQASHIQLAVSSVRVGSPSSGCLHPGWGQSSPFRLGPQERTGPLTAVQVPRPGPGPLPLDPGLVGLWPLSRALAIQVLAEEAGALRGPGRQSGSCLPGAGAGARWSLLPSRPHGPAKPQGTRKHQPSRAAGRQGGRHQETPTPQPRGRPGLQ